MTTLEIPEPEMFTVALDLEKRTTLGPTDETRVHIDRVALGRPFCVTIDPATVDADAKSFLRARAESTFSLLALTTSFTPDEENPLESAWVDVTLRTNEPPRAPEPIAWAMKPLAASDPVAVSRTVSFNGSLKFTSELIPIDVGPETGMARETSYERRAVSVEALREGTSRPRWTFFRTEVTQIRGIHRLFLIVETVAGSSGFAKISIGATVRLRRLKVFRYRAPLEHLPDVVQVALPPG